VFAERTRPGDPAHEATIAVFRADYTRMRRDLDARPLAEAQRELRTLQKYTGATLRELYGRTRDSDAQAVLPAPYRGDGFRQQETTLTESWPTNGTTVSSGQDNPWNEDAQDVAVSSNQLRIPVNGQFPVARCTTSLSTDNHRHSLTALLGAGSNRVAMPSVRKDASTTLTFYGFFCDRAAARELRKYVAGTPTALANDTTDVGNPATLECRAVGSAIDGRLASVIALSASDSAITGNLQCSVRLYRAANPAAEVHVDDHTMEDVAGGGGARAMHHYRLRR
jgi:hypothetical protein